MGLANPGSRWGQIYILDSLLRYVPEQRADAEIMAERVIIQLQHANSAVVLTTIKVLLYLMNYMENRRLIDHICKKMGPPLGNTVALSRVTRTDCWGLLSHPTVFRSRSSIRRTSQHFAHHPTETHCPEK